MKKRLLILLLAICIASMCMPAALAAEAPDAKAILKAEEPDANGCFSMELTIYNATFNVFQFALWYDKDTVVPVDASGQETDQFSRFAEQKDSGWMSTVGTAIDQEKPLLEFTGYVTPGQSIAVDAPKQTGVAVVGESGLSLFKFRFKKTGDKPAVICLAVKDKTEAWQESIPEGCIIANAGFGTPIEFDIVFPEKTGENVSEKIEPPESQQPTQPAQSNTAEPTHNNANSVKNPSQTESDKGSAGNHSTRPAQNDGAQENVQTMTREERLKGTVILQVNNAAAAIDGIRQAIYAGEPDVTAYAHDNRTFVPVRFVAEQLGAAVGWENDTHTVIIQKGGKTIRMTVGNQNYQVDTENHIMDAPAEFSGSADNKRTMVPIRFVAEAMDMDVKWDAATNAIIISPKENPWNLNSTLEQGILEDVLKILSPAA